MQIHVLYAREGSQGWCQASGWYWIFYNQKKNKFLRWRGPHLSRRDAMATALAANPNCEIVLWDRGSLDAPNVVTPIPHHPAIVTA
jgi:hypothetical protein